MTTSEIKRCGWGDRYPALTEYHDKEWAVPLHEEDRVFEMFSLDCFQAGLSWATSIK